MQQSKRITKTVKPVRLVKVDQYGDCSASVDRRKCRKFGRNIKRCCEV